MWKHVPARECVHVSLFSNKDKSTLNKSTSHYAEALMHHRSNVSCITDMPLAVFSPPPQSLLHPNHNHKQICLQCNCAHLTANQSCTCLIHFAWSLMCLFVRSFCSSHSRLDCSHSFLFLSKLNKLMGHLV